MNQALTDEILALQQLLQERVDRDPDDLLAHYELTMVMTAAGNAAGAASVLERLLQKDGSLTLAHFLLADLHDRLNKPTKAQQVRQRAMQLTAHSLAEPAHRPATAPTHAAELSQYKEMYADDPNYAEVKYYEHLAADDRLNPVQMALLGQAYQRLGWYHAALEAYKKVLTLDPDNDEAYFEIGNIYKQQKKYQESTRAYQEALRLNPRIAQTHYQLGLALIKLNKKKEAYQQYETLKDLDPRLAEILFTDLQR